MLNLIYTLSDLHEKVIEIYEDIELLTVIALISALSNDKLKQYPKFSNRLMDIRQKAEDYLVTKYACLLEEFSKKLNISQKHVPSEDIELYKLKQVERKLKKEFERTLIKFKDNIALRGSRNKIIGGTLKGLSPINILKAIIGNLSSHFRKTDPEIFGRKIIELNPRSVNNLDLLILSAVNIRDKIMERKTREFQHIQNYLETINEAELVNLLEKETVDLLLNSNVNDIIKKVSELKVKNIIEILNMAIRKEYQKAARLFIHLMNDNNTQNVCYYRYLTHILRSIIRNIDNETIAGSVGFTNMLLSIINEECEGIKLPLVIESFDDIVDMIIHMCLKPQELLVLDLLLVGDIPEKILDSARKYYYSTLTMNFNKREEDVVRILKIILYMLNKDMNVIAFSSIISFLLDLKHLGLIEFDINDLKAYVKQRWRFLALDYNQIANILNENKIDVQTKRALLFASYLTEDNELLIREMEASSNFFYAKNLSFGELKLNLDLDIVKFVLIKDKLINLNIPQKTELIKKLAVDILIDFIQVPKTDVLDEILLLDLYKKLKSSENSELIETAKFLRVFTEIWNKLPGNLANKKSLYTIIFRIVLPEINREKLKIDDFKSFMSELLRVSKQLPLPSYTTKKLNILEELKTFL